MGRELKMVPLDFDWPIGKIWEGYQNKLFAPSTRKCSSCNGNGYSVMANDLLNKWYGYVNFDPSEKDSKPYSAKEDVIVNHALRNVDGNKYYTNDHVKNYIIELECERLCLFFNSHWSHHLNQEEVEWLYEEGRLRSDFKSCPTAHDLNRSYILGFGHGSINCHIVIEKTCKKNGWSVNCSQCDGEGHIYLEDGAKEKIEKWKPVEPPEGDGYQLWETTSEGSPQSPVFTDIDKLCEWCEKNATVFAREKTSKENWKKMLSDDFVYHKEGNLLFM